jgi:hypothetical protein
MAFNGNEGSPVTLATAKKWTKNYRDKNEGKEVIKAHFFGKEKIIQLLDLPESVGIRMYYGVNDENENVLLLVGTKADQNNILPQDENEMIDGSSGAMVLDVSSWCPPFCPDPSDGL